MPLIFFFISIMFFSCQNNPDLVNDLFQTKAFPVEVISKSEMIHTEEGEIKLEIVANKIERFVGDSARLSFSNGFNVKFYNRSGNVTSNLFAKKAIVDEKNNLMTARDSVVLKSKKKKLETELLIWDEKKEKIYTNNDVIITTDNEIIYAKGFESDPNFSDYTLKKISGKMYINSKEK
jgi:LPS export ABC transporter protein LptC